MGKPSTFRSLGKTRNCVALSNSCFSKGALAIDRLSLEMFKANPGISIRRARQSSILGWASRVKSGR